MLLRVLLSLLLLLLLHVVLSLEADGHAGPQPRLEAGARLRGRGGNYYEITCLSNIMITRLYNVY